MVRLWSLVVLLLVLSGAAAWGQDSTAAFADSTQVWHNRVWTHIVERDSLEI